MTQKAKSFRDEVRDVLTNCSVNGIHLRKVNKEFILVKTDQIQHLALETALGVLPEKHKEPRGGYPKDFEEPLKLYDSAYNQALYDMKRQLKQAFALHLEKDVKSDACECCGARAKLPESEVCQECL